MSQALDDWLLEKKSQLVERQIIKTSVLDDFIYAIKGVLFPGFSDEILDRDTYLDLKLSSLQQNLSILLNDIKAISSTDLEVKKLVTAFTEKLPIIDDFLKDDLEAIFEGDPAANSKSEIILCYPGFYAIMIYRIAHELAALQIPILPRILSEHAHSKTGVDIHPNACIGRYFFIDHGTGIVIGETTEIGNHVKLYQGVTLGALSLKEGQKLKGVKRHPTILDGVTIYSEASIFGGETVIGPNITIASNAFITSSVTPDDLKKTKSKKL